LDEVQEFARTIRSFFDQAKEICAEVFDSEVIRLHKLLENPHNVLVHLESASDEGNANSWLVKMEAFLRIQYSEQSLLFEVVEGESINLDANASPNPIDKALMKVLLALVPFERLRSGRLFWQDAEGDSRQLWLETGSESFSLGIEVRPACLVPTRLASLLKDYENN